MKYIKLYEAFESKKLSKTLSYLNKDSKNIFLSKLKEFCDTLDFPYSDLTDDYFQYLPFKLALEKSVNISSGPKACDAKSEDIFDKYGIKGELCKNGKILRKWGKGTREIVCPVCKGTGLKIEKITSEIKLIKFWFNQDGTHVAITGCDGISRDSKKMNKSFSRNIDDYNIVKIIKTGKETDALETGDIVAAPIYGKTVVGICFRQNNDLFLLQDYYNGGVPTDKVWRDFGTKFSYAFGRTALSGRLLAPKNENGIKGTSPYDINTGVVIYDNKIKQMPIDVRDKLKDANFALILDIDKIKNDKFNKKSNKVKSRIELKSGSVLDKNMSDDNIRKRNIEKYIVELSKRINLTTDISNLKKITLKLLGFRNALFLLDFQDINTTSRLANLSNDYYKLISTENDNEKKVVLKLLSDYIEKSLIAYNKISVETTNKLNEIENIIAEKRDVKALELYKLCKKLSFSIQEMIKRSNLECIEDFDILIIKLSNIRLFLRSDKYKLDKVELYFIDYIKRSEARGVVALMNNNYTYNRNGYVDGLNRLIKLVDRM